MIVWIKKVNASYKVKENIAKIIPIFNWRFSVSQKNCVILVPHVIVKKHRKYFFPHVIAIPRYKNLIFYYIISSQ
jgi:hypothetical protein